MVSLLAELSYQGNRILICLFPTRMTFQSVIETFYVQCKYFTSRKNLIKSNHVIRFSGTSDSQGPKAVVC